MLFEHTSLAFIEYKPMTGYDLKKNFDQSRVHFWSVTQRPIYKAPDGLEKKGRAEAQVIPQEGKPDRKQDQSTAKGRGELLHWLITPVAQAAIHENAGQVNVERARQLWQITLDDGINYYERELFWLEKTILKVRTLPPLILSKSKKGISNEPYSP